MAASLTRRLLGGVAAVLSTAGLLGAHGGTYYGPGTGLPPGGAPMGPAAPTGPVATGAPSAGGATVATGAGIGGGPDVTSWQTWWALHRALYLNLRQALQQNSVATGTDDAFFGLGSTLARSGGRPGNELIRARVLPALLRVLDGERNPDLQSGALLALAKAADPRLDTDGHVVAMLRKHLASSNQEVAETAAIGLGVLGDSSVTPLLVSLLQDDAAGRAVAGQGSVPTRSRAFAAYALGLIGQRQANPDVRRYCAGALARALDHEGPSSGDLDVACALGLGLVPVLPERFAGKPELARTTPWASREQELEWLGDLCKDAGQPVVLRSFLPVTLARLAHGTDEELSRRVERELMLLANPEARVPSPVQASAVTALGLLGDNDEDALDRSIAEALRQATRTGDGQSRRLAYIALARSAARDGQAGGREDGVRGARAFLVSELGTVSSLVRPWVGLALGILEHGRVRGGEPAAPETLRALRSALTRHDGPTEGGAYVIALALARDTSAREQILEQATRTQDEDLQAQACLALGMLGDPASIEALRGVVLGARHRPAVLRDASIALGLLGDHELVPLLVGWLRDGPNVGVLSATATALGWIGDRRAIEPLCALLESREVPDRARGFAAVALGLICEKDLLPWNTIYGRDLNWGLAPPTLLDPFGGTGVLDLL